MDTLPKIVPPKFAIIAKDADTQLNSARKTQATIGKNATILGTLKKIAEVKCAKIVEKRDISKKIAGKTKYVIDVERKDIQPTDANLDARDAIEEDIPMAIAIKR